MKKSFLYSCVLLLLLGCTESPKNEVEAVAFNVCEFTKDYNSNRKEWKPIALSKVRRHLIGKSNTDPQAIFSDSKEKEQFLDKIDCSIKSVDRIEEQRFKVNFDNFYSLYVRNVNGKLKVFKISNDGFDPA